VLTGHAKTSKNIGVIDMNDDVNKAFGFGFVFGVLLSAIPWVFLGGFMARIDLREAAIKAKVNITFKANRTTFLPIFHIHF
jgi:hypothetical protein